jgi:hypothetical protein
VSQYISKTFSATLEADPSCSIMKLLTSIHSFIQLYPLVRKDYPDRLYYASSPLQRYIPSTLVLLSADRTCEA